MSDLLNRMISGRLEEAADLRRADGADSVYVQAYTRAASSVRQWPISLAVMFRHRGVEGLEEVPGIGPAIARVIREILTHHRLPAFGRLREPPEGSPSVATVALPSIEELLDVDGEYRQKAAGGELQLIAPLRFNPAYERWLPVLHTHRHSRHYTALYSNTERAHRFGRTRDWVVLYCRDAAGERQYTVMTSTHGILREHRVVAGREGECRSAARRAA